MTEKIYKLQKCINHNINCLNHNLLKIDIFDDIVKL